MADARYVVGIDLGTTNCVLAWVDTRAEIDVDAPPSQVLAVPQLIKPGVVESRTQLPSFLYLPAAEEMKPESLALPWGTAEHVVGELARARGAEVPARVVASAKSWLCLGRRRPEPADPAVAGARTTCRSSRRSTPRRPTCGTCVRHGTPRCPAPLAEQELYLTVPASFDAAARDLTVRAAAQAGLRGVTPPRGAAGGVLRLARATAASGGATWCGVGDMVLVCDVGGGTTDLTLVAVGEEQGSLVARAARRRQSHPARRRQHGPRPWPTPSARGSPTAARRSTTGSPRPRARLPRRQGSAARGQRAGRGAGGRARDGRAR